MKKIRLATSFSGIGSIEQSLSRLNMDHEIVFACDNGNIEIDVDYENEMKYIKTLNSYQEKNKYVKSLYKSKSRKTNFVELTYKNNYPIEDDRFFYDVKLLDGTDFKDQVDLYVGGSPCQSFSVIGARGGLEDTRGTLFYEYVRLIKEIQPKIFIYENVYGVLTHDKGQTWEIMQNVFRELGYKFDYRILDSRDYGIPQGRRRLFVVGFKDEKVFKNFRFPEPKILNYRMQDFLLDNCAIGNFNSVNGEIVLKTEGQEVPEECFLSEKLIKYVLSPGTKNFMHLDAKTDLEIARAILSTQGNTHRASVNNYVTTNGRLRALHPRESLRLMGYPDTFKMTVSKSQSYKQSGNSIVVDVMMSIIKQIVKAEEDTYGKN